jgi:hypothetical protein
VSVSADSGSGAHIRSLRKPYQAGSSTAYTLPSLISGATWSLVPNATMTWTTLSTPFTSFDVTLYSNSADAYYDLAATTNFIAATGTHQLTLATNLPGYQTAWLGDLSKGYDLDITIQNVTDQVETESLDQQVATSARTVVASCSGHGEPDLAQGPRARSCGISARVDRVSARR